MKQEEFEITKVNRDINGNPRYVVHFFALLTDKEQADIDREFKGTGIGANIHEMYRIAAKKAKAIGGKKYRGKDFGGGIVFQAYSASELRRLINELLGVEA